MPEYPSSSFPTKNEEKWMNGWWIINAKPALTKDLKFKLRWAMFQMASYMNQAGTCISCEVLFS